MICRLDALNCPTAYDATLGRMHPAAPTQLYERREDGVTLDEV